MAKGFTKSQAMDVLNKADKLKKKELKRTRFEHGAGPKDQLAGGAPSATYRMPSVSQMEWDLIWLTDKKFLKTYGMTKEEARG